jgi:hypothetical protein
LSNQVAQPTPITNYLENGLKRPARIIIRNESMFFGDLFPPPLGLLLALAGFTFSSHGINLEHMLILFVPHRVVIASGALWCVAGISASDAEERKQRTGDSRWVSADGSHQNGPASRRLAASLGSVNVGASRPVLSPKHENFASEGCDRRR